MACYLVKTDKTMIQNIRNIHIPICFRCLRNILLWQYISSGYYFCTDAEMSKRMFVILKYIINVILYTNIWINDKNKTLKKKHTYNSHPVITVFMLSLPSDPDKKLL